MPPRCHIASKARSEPATPALSDSLAPAMAMETDASQSATSSREALGLVADDDHAGASQVERAVVDGRRARPMA